ncbi:hypothetical protein [Bacillus cereus]
MRDSYKKRRNFMTTSFNEMGLTCHVPGGSGEGFIRCSYATSLEQLMEAMKRMERFIENKKRTKHNTFCP